MSILETGWIDDWNLIGMKKTWLSWESCLIYTQHIVWKICSLNLFYHLLIFASYKPASLLRLFIRKKKYCVRMKKHQKSNNRVIRPQNIDATITTTTACSCLSIISLYMIWKIQKIGNKIKIMRAAHICIMQYKIMLKRGQNLVKNYCNNKYRYWYDLVWVW